MPGLHVGVEDPHWETVSRALPPQSHLPRTTFVISNNVIMKYAVTLLPTPSLFSTVCCLVVAGCFVGFIFF